PAPDPCVPVHGGDCLPVPEFEAEAEAISGWMTLHPGFRNQWGLEEIGAHRAYAHLRLLEGPDAEPGAGVTIGFIDSGIDLEHRSFAGRSIYFQPLFGAEPETGVDDFSHGTAVASVAAGSRLSDTVTGNLGLAWGADLAMWSIPLGSGGGPYQPITLEQVGEGDPGFAHIFQTAFAWRDAGNRLDILNLSFGYNGLLESYDAADLRANMPELVATLAQAGADEKTILVWAAGNAHGSRCAPGVPGCVNGYVNATSASILAGLPAYFEELRGHSVAAVALNPHDGAISEFSNRCGIAADYCIAAPGYGVRVAYFGPYMGEAFRGYATGGGTSYAAPFVAGGLAIMKQLFRDQLSNEELVTRLFATADKTGVYADREVYGQGKMDLGAATSPVGVLDVPITNGLAHASLGTTGLRLGAAFGDGLAASFDGDEIMALDDYGAPFWHDMGNFAATTDGPALSARLRTFLGAGSGGLTAGGGSSGGMPAALGMTAGVVRMPTAAGNGHLALAEGAVQVNAYEAGGLSATAFTTGPLRPAMPATGAALAWRPGSLPVGLRAGWISERETMLGSLGTGAFGGLSAGTAFFGFDGGMDFRGWNLGAAGEFGVVNPASTGGLIQEITPLATSTFAVHASRALSRAGSFSFSLSQPLRVENGWAALTAPSARTKQGEVLYRSFRADLAPGERQLDLAAQWNRVLPLGELRLGAVWSHWPGHRAVLGTQAAALAGWRWVF
ncbi:MAG: S8 family serine peptidase, partial [Acidobacteria bacterium]|nr:S8 family serine peptidase [Acidobacteriota bacterium]